MGDHELWYPTGRQASWARKSRAMDRNAFRHREDGIIQLDFGALGTDMVTRHPVYDNGRYFVIDTVLDVQFTVLRWPDEQWGPMGRPLLQTVDKYEAIIAADKELELELEVARQDERGVDL